MPMNIMIVKYKQKQSKRDNHYLLPQPPGGPGGPV